MTEGILKWQLDSWTRVFGNGASRTQWTSLNNRFKKKEKQEIKRPTPPKKTKNKKTTRSSAGLLIWLHIPRTHAGVLPSRIITETESFPCHFGSSLQLHNQTSLSDKLTVAGSEDVF